jgi:hypothetical protein
MDDLGSLLVLFLVGVLSLVFAGKNRSYPDRVIESLRKQNRIKEGKWLRFKRGLKRIFHKDKKNK